ncbi:ATP-binding protein [Haloarchaeobius amylolyticus]|uniref:histidine kinase n=1 Tax=Haloarchaeobius amylolyticus TaxID=1198296 RepID=A0ABD6BDZ2_9EURY
MKTKRLFLLLIALIAVVLSASVVVGFQHHKDALYTHEETELERATMHVQSELDGQLDALQRTAEIGATNPELTRHGSASQRRTLETFVERSSFAGASVIAANGTMTNIVADSGRPDDTVGGDFGDRVYFQRAMAGETYVSEPIEAESGNYILTISTPLYENGTRVGTLNAAFHLEDGDFFAQFSSTLEDGQGLTIESQSGERIYTATPSPNADLMERQTTLSETGWTITVSESRVPIQERSRELTVLQGGALLFVLGTLSLFGWWVYRRNLAQLEELLAGFEALENREYQTRIALEGADEWQHIGHGFNQLSRTLDGHMRERQAYERRLETQRDNLETLNQVLRHDIRNDLQLVLAYGDLLADHVEAGSDGEEYLETLQDSASQAVELTETAREMADVMLTNAADRQQLFLSPVITNVIEDVRSQYTNAEVAIEGRVPETAVLANGMLESVFRNLVTNAIQHNDKAVPEVTVSVDDDGSDVTVRVADNGPGIPDAQKEEIFGKGEHGLESAGTGLGLYLARTLVDAYGGDIQVEDNDPEGAVFVVTLPKAE